MIIESKFNFGDKVYPITKQPELIWISCESCNGSGTINLKNNKEYTCPICYGLKGKVDRGKEKWRLVDDFSEENKKRYQEQGRRLSVPLTIGKIDAECTPDKIKFGYMCIETEIDSGDRRNENNLFISREEAQKECDKRNKESDENSKYND